MDVGSRKPAVVSAARYSGKSSSLVAPEFRRGVRMLSTWLTKVFGASWRSTLAGYIIAIGNVVIPLMQDKTPTIKQVLASAAIATAGHFIKDANVTGGNTPNTINNPEVVSRTADTK